MILDNLKTKLLYWSGWDLLLSYEYLTRLGEARPQEFTLPYEIPAQWASIQFLDETLDFAISDSKQSSICFAYLLASLLKTSFFFILCSIVFLTILV